MDCRPSGGFSRLALDQVIAFTIHPEEVDLMGQLVEERPSQALGSEGSRPFIEGQVGRDQNSCAREPCLRDL